MCFIADFVLYLQLERKQEENEQMQGTDITIQQRCRSF